MLEHGVAMVCIHTCIYMCRTGYMGTHIGSWVHVMCCQHGAEHGVGALALQYVSKTVYSSGSTIR